MIRVSRQMATHRSAAGSHAGSTWLGLISVPLKPGLNLEVVTTLERSLVFHRYIRKISYANYSDIDAPCTINVISPPQLESLQNFYSLYSDLSLGRGAYYSS